MKQNKKLNSLMLIGVLTGLGVNAYAEISVDTFNGVLTISSDIDVETNIRIGVPFQALLEEIKEKGPDLLVMGAKGRSNVVDMILGSMMVPKRGVLNRIVRNKPARMCRVGVFIWPE